MKKTFSLILTLALTLAIAMGVGVPAFAYTTSESGDVIWGDSRDDGYVTLDTVITNGAIYDDGTTRFTRGPITVGDLFWTGTIGSAESSGTLNYFNDSVTWTLKDGVLVLTAHPEKAGRQDVAVDKSSPFWNNEHIETIVIDSNIYSLGSTLFTFGLPNLKTVIFLGNTGFSVKGYVKPGLPTIGGVFRANLGEFPTEQEINYVWEVCHDMQGYAEDYAHRYDESDYIGPLSAVGTSIIGVDTPNGNSDRTPAKFLTENQFFTDRADYLAAAAPVVARATMTKETVDMLPEDMVAAVAAIGGFKCFGGNPLSAEEAARKYHETNGVNVTVNDTPVAWTDAYPFVDINSRTMVPLRAVANAIGLSVEWNDEEKTAKFSRSNDDYIVFGIYSKTASSTLHGFIDMDTEPVIRNDRTYAPIRYLAENFGYTVDWDAATKTVEITTPNSSEVNYAFALGIGTSLKDEDLSAGITRKQFASLVFGTYTAITGQRPPNMSNPSVFKDMDDVTKIDGSALYANALGVMDPLDDGMFHGDYNITREAAAVMFNRLATACGAQVPDSSRMFTDGVGSSGAKDNYTIEETLISMTRVYDHVINNTL